MILAAVAQRTVRVLASTRLSSDPGGRRITHESQRRAISQLVEREGLPPVAEGDWFTDTDKSASKVGVVRPEWERLLATVESVDPRTMQVVVVAYAQDRLQRQVEDLPRLANLLDRKNGQLWTAMQGQVSIKKGGRVSYYLQGVVAADESEKISARTTVGLASAAMAGKPHGRVSYGWSRQYTSVGAGKAVGKEVVNPEQQAVVVDMARRVLAGHSLYSIVADLNDRGVPAPGAGRVLSRDPVTREAIAWGDGGWNRNKIRHILLRKSNVGVRVHAAGGQGGDGLAVEYDAAWPALLDEATYAQVCAVLRSPERRTSLSNKAVHLLSGIAVCAVCERPVTAQKESGGRLNSVYRCARSHVVKAKAATDMVVTEQLLQYLTSPELRAALSQGASDGRVQAEADRAVQRAKLAELEAAYDQDEMPLDTFLRLSTRARTKLVEAEAVLARRRDGAVYADLVAADDVVQEWEATPLDRKRAVITALFTVTLLKANSRGRSAFDPSTIVMEKKDVAGGGQ
jgi:DNA invertase Pin-like site-specific DNA recombinase